MIIVSDTSPISNLIQINRLFLLQKMYGKIIVPPKVHEEILELSVLGDDISKYLLADWIEIIAPSDSEAVHKLLFDLDEGESEAIALAQELKPDFLLIDERKGWNTAKSLGINAIGLVGVLLKAKAQNLIPAVLPIIDDLRNLAGFWISDGFYAQIKMLSKE